MQKILTNNKLERVQVWHFCMKNDQKKNEDYFCAD